MADLNTPHLVWECHVSLFLKSTVTLLWVTFFPSLAHNKFNQSHEQKVSSFYLQACNDSKNLNLCQTFRKEHSGLQSSLVTFDMHIFQAHKILQRHESSLLLCQAWAWGSLWNLMSSLPRCAMHPFPPVSSPSCER